MKTAAYTSTLTESGKAGSYPVSTQTLDFIQSQILLLQKLALIGGSRYILQEPDGTNIGYVVIDGEVLALPATPKLTSSVKYVSVKTETEDIEADGETYLEARTTRTAVLSASKLNVEDYDINTFSKLYSNSTLKANMEQVPAVVLAYLQDVLAEKLSSLSVASMTAAKLDAVRTPCVISCSDSVALFEKQTSYNITVRQMGAVIQQELMLQDNQRFARTYRNGKWSGWSKITENLHIEVKIVKGVVYLRHGQLPSNASIVLLRKKKRSKWRHTGGKDSYSDNFGKRVSRSPKTQYVHFKGITLTQGEANKWYVPKCATVADMAVDSALIDRELSTLCKSLIYADAKGGLRIQGVRNKISINEGDDSQSVGYASIGIQVATYKNGSKDAGGEIVKMKYRISRHRKGHTWLPYYIWYRSFSLE